MELPEGLEKFLEKIGVNTVRLKWKLLDLSRWWDRQKARFQPKEKGQKYKYCRCGHLYLAEDKVCESCGRKLPSYTGYRIRRLLAIQLPESNAVSMIFLITIIVLFALQAMVYGAKSLLAPEMDGLIAFGAMTGNLVRDGQIWRILSMALVHIGIIHILFNAMAMSQMLPHFEKEIGVWRTVFLLTATQLAAAMAHLIFYNPMIITGGASGIAFGLIGFGVAYFRRKRMRQESRFFFQWFIYGLIFGIFIGANNAAHIGGFLAGLPLGYLFAGKYPGPQGRLIWKIVGILCLLAWASTLVFLALSIIKGTAGT